MAVGASGGYRTATIVECPVCGLYEITHLTEAALGRGSGVDEDLRWRITWATRHAWEAGAIKVLDTDELRRLAESEVEPRSPIEKANSLLLLIAARSGGLGDRAPFNAATEWPLLYAHGPDEATRLLAALANKGLVKMTMDPAEGVELTYPGWEIANSVPSPSALKSTKAFVAMWFDPTMNAAYDEGFQPALYGLGYDPVRVDRQEFLGKIDDYIVKSIRESVLVVADFTEHRHGVYWEAGFAYGLGLPVIYTCRSDEIAKAHFDTRQYNHLLWNEPNELRMRLTERIQATMTTRPKQRSLKP